MNFRVIFNWLKSPTSKIIFFFVILIFGVLIAIPFLSDKEEKVITVESELSEKERKPIFVDTNMEAFRKRKEDPKVLINNDVTPPVIGDPEEKVIKMEQATPRVASESSDTSSGVAGNRLTANRKVQMNPDEGQNRRTMLIIDGETGDAGSERDVFISDRFVPYGSLICCKLVSTLESNVPNTPLIAVTTEDLCWTNAKGEKKLIIPANTIVNGTVGGTVRNRMTTGSTFILVFQRTSELNGYEISLTGIGLEKSNEPGRKDRATITDMAAGIPGQVMANNDLNEMLQYTFAFVQGLSQGFQSNTVAATNSSVIVSNDGSTKNAIAMGMESLSQMALQNISDRIAKESYFVRVAAGTEFYLYVQQVINLDDAKIAGTLLNKPASGGEPAKTGVSAGEDIRRKYNEDMNNLSSPQGNKNMIMRQSRFY